MRPSRASCSTRPSRSRAIDLPLRNDAHRLIEECMVLANVATARELGNRKMPTLYRVHAEPDERKLEMLTTTLRALGVGVDLPAEDHHPRPAEDRAAHPGSGRATVHRDADRAFA